MNKKILMLGIMLMMSFSVYTVNAQTTQVGNPKPTIEVETIQVLEGTITIRKVEYDILPEDGQIDSFFLSETFFGDDI
jgi:hypothetical protein